MNLRCIYCQTPFTLARAEMLTAIVTMNERHQNHYDAHCPRCRRANSISRQRMELFFPNWQEAAKQAEKAPAAPPPAPASTSLKTEPLPKGAKEAALIKEARKPAAKAKPAAKTAEKKPAAKKQTASKPAEKKASDKGKKK
jgi:phage FluMu protein Com